MVIVGSTDMLFISVYEALSKKLSNLSFVSYTQMETGRGMFKTNEFAYPEYRLESPSVALCSN